MYTYSETYPEIDGERMPISLGELVADQLELPGSSVTLRPLTEADANEYFALIEYDREHLSQFGDKTAKKYQTPEDVLESIIDPDNPFKLRFGIWNGETMVGSINLTPLEYQRAEIGYWIGKQHIGKGYASDALTSLTDFAFNALGYEELEAEAVDDNTASRKTLEKCGFTETGDIRGRMFTDDNDQPQTRIYTVYTAKA